MIAGRDYMSSGRVVIVNGKSYPVVEKPGYLKADMGGIFGWTAVWAPRTIEISEQTGMPVDVTAFVLIDRVRKAIALGNYGAPTGSR
jgi:hypothetical protein